MDIFQKKSQCDLDLYSSQRHLVDTEIHSVGDDISTSISNIVSPGKQKKKKTNNDITVLEKYPQLGQNNYSYQHNHNTDDLDSSEQEINDSSLTQPDTKQFEKLLHEVDSEKQIETSISSLNSNNKFIVDNKKVQKKKFRTSSGRKHENSSISLSPKTNNISDDFELATIKENRQEKKTLNYKIMGIYIHKSDTLKTHLFVTACKIKINIYNYETGKCLNNSKLCKAKFQTHIWDCSVMRTTEPQWNELVIFEKSLVELMEKSKNIIIFMELYDMRKKLPANDTDSIFSYHELISWCFLKPISENEKSYLNKKVKLQLFEPINWNRSSKIFSCWSNRPWKAYPSTLHITVKGYKVNNEEEYMSTIQYSAYNLIKHYNNNSDRHCPNKIQSSDAGAGLESLKKRDDKEKCKILNSVSKTIQSGGKMCFTMKYSPCGNYLAYATKLEDNNTIIILRVPSLSQDIRLTKHKNIIYDLSWNTTSNMLVSASSDATVCIWELKDNKFVLLQQLNHETFVYSARFCETPENIIATGCFDKIVRLWLLNEDKKYNLHQEVSGHEGFINAVCFGKRSKSLYTGDSTGLIIKWSYESGEWQHLLSIKCSEIRNHIINDLIIFPNNQKLLIVLRNSVSWALDTSTSTVVLCYRNGINYRYQLRGCISPCGSLVIIGNCIWRAATAQLVAIYNPTVFDYHTVTAVDHHPYYNLTSIACGFMTAPILICTNQTRKNYDKSLNLEEFKYESVQNHSLNDIESNLQYNKQIQTKGKETANTSKFLHNSVEFSESFHETEKRHSSKLWHIINKMDMVISTIKKQKKSNDVQYDTHTQMDDDKANTLLDNIDAMESVIQTSRNVNDYINSLPQELHENMLNKQEQEELKIDIESQNSDGTYTIENDEHSTLSEAESIHTYTVSPKK